MNTTEHTAAWASEMKIRGQGEAELPGGLREGAHTGLGMSTLSFPTWLRISLSHTSPSGIETSPLTGSSV